ncbi:MFS general substrate transporter [Cylindrobasidium torrendii FP15055 ss-10]|uniref:MFS general substrate transporter n=1 Tax=Cylindrobasidium torrendii FP15055 ss-10 TaxID=1314674 RepID=A0A0D7BJU1_9AGAR|nr:MFS general substrate transporter [Cylindrobasidium torrendii FP15055 ss-10]
MSSFSMSVRPHMQRPPHGHDSDEEAVDMNEMHDMPAPLRHNTSHLPVEIHPLPTHDRIRRPSAVRLESSATMSYKEGHTEPSTPAYEFKKTPFNESVSPVELKDTPTLHNVPDAATKKKHTRTSNIHFIAVTFAFFLSGWQDGTTGPLLPVMQTHYHIGFVLVSLVFVFACSGFILGAGLNVWINEKLGFGKTMVLGSVFQIVAYALNSPGPPFPVLVLGYFCSGFGVSLQNAQGNGFVGSLKEHKTTKLNMLHAGYGVGAFIAPLVSTKFSESEHWSYHFIISTGLAVLNTVMLTAVFRGKRQEDLMAEAGQERVIGEDNVGDTNVYKAIISINAVHYMAIFALIYIGTEVTLGGWIVTFIINERGGGPSAGYISSGFFGGLTLGRLVLIWVSKKVGEHRVVFLYSFIAIALELTIWFVPSIIENAVAVSVIGMLLGPMYPILVGHCTRILPPWLLTGSVGWITGIGVSGSAMMPFFTGLIASRYGIKSLQPLVIAMMCSMVGLWALVPRAPRRLIE